MTQPPLISVVVPSYNCAQYLGQALSSALDQDYPNKEIIVVDDGSTDDSIAILAGFGERIRVIKQPNSGVAVARNTGLRAARGDYIAFLDADDLWLPGKLTAQATYLDRHPDVGMVYCAWRVWRTDANGEFSIPQKENDEAADLSIDPERSGWLYNKLFFSSIIHTTTAMIRREVADAVGFFDPTLKVGEDYEFWFRASRVAPIHKLKTWLSLYRMHESSITKKPHAVNYAAQVLQRALDRWGRIGPDGTETPQAAIDKIMADLWFGYAYQHLKGGNPKLARDGFLQCVRYHPLWVMAWINVVRSIVAMFGLNIEPARK